MKNELFASMIVKSEVHFINAVSKLANQKNAKLFCCQVQGDVFRISTSKKVQDFNFKNYDSDEEIIRLVQKAIHLLHTKLPHQKLLFTPEYLKDIL